MEGKKQAQAECLSQWHLYTVFVACTLLDVVGQILAASLLQFHCFTWHCTDVTESTWPNLLLLLFFFLNLIFLHMLPCLGAHYSIEIQRSITSNYRSLSSGLHCTFPRRLSWLTIYPEEQNAASVNHGIWCEILVRAC